MEVTVHSGDNLIDWGVTGDERIIQNVRNIIRTRRFEVPFLREMGMNPEFIDASYNQIKSMLASDVMETIKTYESRATVLDVIIENLDENGNYDIAVKLEV